MKLLLTMDDKTRSKTKKELMKPDWTENLHHALEELPETDAKAIVEAMTRKEIYNKVNIRKSQQDYISDYLEYLWKISESAYWKHVIVTLDIKVGLLWGDLMEHFGKMCNLRVPDEVLKAVLDFAVGCNEKYRQDFDAIGCVVKAQVEKFQRLDEIKNYISSLDEGKQTNAEKRIKEMISNKCNYSFQYRSPQ
jgi:NAD-dependent DNA ligase